ncbi:FGGY-family carbohydrate kinase [Tepidanaerobacter acetatoxydans]|nr:FGGY-family carbohydrate kinase [Tepidanaerobacter acetatoxydans]
MYILSLDVGTSSMRGIIYDERGKLIYSCQEHYKVEYKPPNIVKQDPLTWKRALYNVLNCISEYVKQQNIDLEAICVTSQRASVIPVDRENQPLYDAIMWQDKRSYKQCSDINKIISSEELYKKTGLVLDPYFSLPKMIWLKQEKPEIYKKTYKLIGVQDYIIFLLTNKYVTDWTQASRTMLMNISNFKWDDSIIDQVGLDKSLLPELCPPGSIVGQMSEEVSKLTNLKTGIPVIISGGDQQCAAIALNVIKPGIVEVNTGTGSFIIMYSDKPIFDKNNTRTLCSAAAIPGKWIVEAGVLTTGSIYGWVKEQFYKDDENFVQINKEVEQAPVGSDGVVMLPHFEGSAAPYWNPLATGLIFNLTLGTKRASIARSALEGITLELAENIKLLEQVTEAEIHTVTIAGGLTKFDVFNEIQADAFNKQVVKFKNSEATSFGAAISAMVTLGIYASYEIALQKIQKEKDKITYTPNMENVEKYKKIAWRKNELYKALDDKNIYRTLQNDIQLIHS